MDNKLVIRTYFVDDSFKTLAVAPTISARELSIVVAEKIELEQRETFALFFYKNGECRCLDDDEQPCKLMVYETVGSDADFQKYVNDKAEWEKLKKDWEKDSKLVFKRRVFLKHKAIPREQEKFLNYSYIQAVADVRDGTYPCSQSAAIELAGLQMQVTFGDHNKKKHTAGFLKDKIGRFIPAPLLQSNRKLEDWERDVFQEHARLIGLKKEDAMLHYLNYVRNWSFYGSTFWTVQTVNKDQANLPDQVILAVNSNGIQLLKLGTKEPILTQRYADIYSWAYKRNAFAFVSGVLSKQKFQFATPHGRDISRTLQAYVEILLDERKKDNKTYQSTNM
ncbi:hypothetical protein FDP41_011951 [Naegleria fowleri]|uniref:FERM domain-containing protein n=1 Tax=Naegleria fowleri TaxID=5763 RepID=A0A6A5C8K4_NAEFO|nr:uncharacterized protein FDP41_011951 [Naegleria fowleri]KAF0982090.1 hypothetical protein FDP41_011951 [Naegleria fowleri]CAG4712889.1 unnamed protein product [Naegleria fowleri]